MNSEIKEKILRLWFKMWLEKKDLGIDQIFASTALYTESWGPFYTGSKEIKHWFEEYNTRGRVTCWDIKRFIHLHNETFVFWHFAAQMKNGTKEEFDGISVVYWDENGLIEKLTEYGCNCAHYNPYQNTASFQGKPSKNRWF